MPGYVKIYQRETELSEFSWDANKEGLKIKNDIFLKWFHRNDFVAMALFQFVTIDFVFPVMICLPTKLPSFLTMGYTGKYRAVVRDFQASENAELAVWTFLQWLTGNNAWECVKVNLLVNLKLLIFWRKLHYRCLIGYCASYGYLLVL